MNLNSVFEANPKAKEIFAFEDGNAFLSEDAAKNHKKNNGGDYETVTRPDESELKAPAKKNAADLISAISNATSVEEVDTIVGTDTRKTVVDAANAKKESFKA